MTERLLRVRTGRQPHEVAILVASVALGIVGTVLPQRISPAIAAEFDMFWGRAFWIALVLFAGVTLYGIYRRRIEGLLIERAGLTVMAALYGTYIYASLAVNGLDGVTSIALPLSFVVANLARCWQIRTDLVLMSSYLKEHPGVDLR